MQGDPVPQEDPWNTRTGLVTYPKGYVSPQTFTAPPSSFLLGLYHKATSSMTLRKFISHRPRFREGSSENHVREHGKFVSNPFTRSCSFIRFQRTNRGKTSFTITDYFWGTFRPSNEIYSDCQLPKFKQKKNHISCYLLF